MEATASSDGLFFARLGFDEKDREAIDSLFVMEECSFMQCLEVKINRILHFIKCGIWVNPHRVGQALNEHRFRKGVEEGDIKRIEKLFSERLSDRFIDKAYEEAAKESFLEAVKTGLDFFATFLKSPLTVGAILPSSDSLAYEIAAKIEKRAEGGGICILEAGPGTGTFTREIIKRLGPDDQLDLVEYDEKFVQTLRKRYGHLNNVKIIHGDFTEYRPGKKYDYCISGLPLASFTREMVEKVYDVFNSAIKQEGKLAYFEYIGIPHIKNLFIGEEEKREFSKLLKIKQSFYNEHRGEAKEIWLNIPPARILLVTV